MTRALALLAILLTPAQERKDVEIIPRGHSLRGQYTDALRKCVAAEALLKTNPRETVRILDAVIALRLEKVECRMQIVVRANEYFPDLSKPPANFNPYEFRGKAHLALSRTLEGAPSRTHLLKAIVDLKHSSSPVSQGGKNNRNSLASFGEVRRLMVQGLQSALAHATWDPEDTILPAHAREFLSTWPQEAKAVSSWMEEERARVAGLADRWKKGTPKEAATKRQARRMVQWCDGMGTALAGVAGFEKSLAALAQVRKDAQWVVDYRGTFTLAISVYPFARIEKLSLAGRDVTLDQRTTPIRIRRELEIADLEVVLYHPGLKVRKKFACDATDLLDDQAYVISGTMEGDSLLNFGSLE